MAKYKVRRSTKSLAADPVQARMLIPSSPPPPSAFCPLFYRPPLLPLFVIHPSHTMSRSMCVLALVLCFAMGTMAFLPQTPATRGKS